MPILGCIPELLKGGKGIWYQLVLRHRRAYNGIMASVVNFADPDFEPTDEQLEELMREAFAHVAEANRAALQRLEEQIQRTRAELAAARNKTEGR